jgi:transglutaminase-like putative cysteine protease
MAVLGEIRHTTSYKYAKPVTFGTHRAMFLPRRGASARLLNWSARTNPPSKVHWISDSRSNSVTVMDFSEPSSELTFEFKVLGIYFGIKGVEAFPLESRAEEVPVQYTPDEWNDLAGYLRPHAEDPDSGLAAWTKSFVAGDQDQTTDALRRILHTFRDNFTYRARQSPGTQSPGETLRTKSGTCRDYAWLMIETLRRLGFASRFVSGYLYDRALDGGAIGMAGSGSTHVWHGLRPNQPNQCRICLFRWPLPDIQARQSRWRARGLATQKIIWACRLTLRSTRSMRCLTSHKDRTSSSA